MPGAYPTDPVPNWLKEKPNTKMKGEYENAVANTFHLKGIPANQAVRLNFPPRDALPQIKREHKRWKSVTNDMMTTTNKCIAGLY